MKLLKDHVLVSVCIEHPFFGKLRISIQQRKKVDFQSNLEKKIFPWFADELPILSNTEITRISDDPVLEHSEIIVPWNFKT